MLENRVKEETAPTLQILSDARIRSVMITGDNPLTGKPVFSLTLVHLLLLDKWVSCDLILNVLCAALSVGRKCGLVPHDMQIFVSHLEEVVTPMGNKHVIVKWINSENPNIKLDPERLVRTLHMFPADHCIMPVLTDRCFV